MPGFNERLSSEVRLCLKLDEAELGKDLGEDGRLGILAQLELGEV